MAELKSTQQEETAAQKFEWKRIFNHHWVVKNIPFFLFLAALTVIYIANGHYADKTIRRIETAEKHLKEMEYEFKTTKRDVMFRSKESELVKAVEPLGLKELISPPMKIADSTDQ